MLGRNERRQAAHDALAMVRQQLALALGAARNATDHATTTAAAHEFERWLMQHGVEATTRPDRLDMQEKLAGFLTDPRMQQVLDAAKAEHAAFYSQWRSNGPAELSAHVARYADGAASLPWQHWLGVPGEHDGTGTFPALWRLGSAALTDTAEDSFPFAVPLLDRSHLRFISVPGSRLSIESTIETLLLRLLSTFAPGLIRVDAWDIGQLASCLPNLYPLTNSGILTIHDPTRLDDILASLAGHVRRIHMSNLRGGYGNLPEACVAAGRRVEPWRIAVLFGNGEKLSDEQQRELQRIARNGIDVGVHLIVVDVPLSANSPMETLSLQDSEHATSSMTGPGFTVTLDPALTATQVSRQATAISKALLTMRGKPREFVDLLPVELGTHSSTEELRADIGFAEGNPVELVIGDGSPHALIAGPSGSGKTNFLYAMLGSLAARYSPDELELYLLDFKEGVSFAGLAPGKKDPSWLPHARLVGVNVNSDREFGVALLRFLATEMARRATAAKEHEVTKLAELRAEDPTGHWPRIIAVIDEFQFMFAGRDALVNEATALLEDIARRGRSQGIHLVLASQDIAGIDAFWGKPAIFEQCTLRIAMPKANRVLAATNEVAVALPRWHAVVNHDSGVAHGNAIAHIPDSGGRDGFPALQKRLWEQFGSSNPAPRLFDGDVAPVLVLPAVAEKTEPVATIGQVIDVADVVAGFPLNHAPGRNLAVFGTTVKEALSTLDTATLSAARQYAPGSVVFELWSPVAQFSNHVNKLADILRAAGHQVEVSADVAARCVEVTQHIATPRIIVGFSIDAVAHLLEAKSGMPLTSGYDRLRAIWKQGPLSGTHVISWWRSLARFKDAIGFGGLDDVAAWVAFDVQGNELTQLAAGQLVNWSPRANRGLYFDRARHSRPTVIIPFDTASFIPAED
jgi:hypothetical protein